MIEQNINAGSMLSVGSILRGIYRIDSYLSSGGFGNTYVATNVEFDEVVAIKEFFMKGVTQRDANNTTVSVSNTENKNIFDEQLQKFKKEARRLRRLRSPHIVSVHDLFEENGTAYYVMDYIDGENLSIRLKRLQKPLSEAEVMGYLPQILDALECVHQEGIWHLDLKPANIMVDRKGNVSLIDFGASKQRSNKGGATTSTAVSFTNGYAPREQMEQNLEKFGPWTDLYALGATLYNLLANKRPPMPSDIDDDRSADKHLALPLPTGISEKMRNLILRLMTTNRLDRPQSVADVRRIFPKGINVVEAASAEPLENEETMVVERYPRTKTESKDKQSESRIPKDKSKLLEKPEIQEEQNKPIRHTPNNAVLLILAFFSIVLIGILLYFVNSSNSTNYTDTTYAEKQDVPGIEEKPDDVGISLADVVAKAKAEGANWSVDEWKESFKSMALAIKPMMVKLSEIQKKIDAEMEKDPSKALGMLEDLKKVQDEFPDADKLMDEFTQIAESTENGKQVANDEEWGKQLFKELDIPEVDM